MYNHFIVLNFLLSLLTFTGLSAQDKNYEELWVQLEEFRNQSQPKSAYELVQKIYMNAAQEDNYEQLIKSIIYKAALSLDFQDRDPAELIEEFENELTKLKSQSAKAVMHSLLGTIYHHYGMRNLGRFSSRSSGGEAYLPFSSLEDIQKKSIDHFEASMISDHDVSISDLGQTVIDDDKSFWKINAESIESFLLFRAIDHYTNSSAFATLSSGNMVLNDPALFEYGEAFLQIKFENKKDDFHQQCLRLFQQAESASFVSPTNKQKIYFKRLDYVRSNYAISGADSLYIKALNNPDIIAWEDGMAYCKIIDYQLYKATSNTEAGNSESKEAFKQAFRFIQKFQKQFPESEIMDIVLQQRQRLNQRRIEIEMESIVPSRKDFLFYLAYRNVAQAYVHVFELDDKLDSLFNQSSTPKDKLSVLGRAKRIRHWSVNLPSTGDFNYHALELPLEALDYGRYVLVVSDNETLKYKSDKILNLAYFHVSDLAYYGFYENGKYKGTVIDRLSGEAVKGVKVELEEGFYNPLKRRQEFRMVHTTFTDINGVYDCSASESKRFRLRFINGNDTLAPDDINYNYRQNNFVQSRSGALLFTDRGIYRPGQTVYFKTILYNKEPNGETSLAEAGRPLTVYLKDVNNQIVNTVKLKTNEYGSAHGEFVLPKGNLNGQFSLTMDEPLTNQYFRVEEYKRPGIIARFDSITENYVLGDTIELKGRLETYSGLKLENADVRYQVIKKPSRWDYRMAYNSAEELVEVGYISSDEMGEFEINFVTPNLGNNKSFEYSVRCDIKDNTGESTQLEKSFVLSSTPFYIQVDMPEAVMQGDSWSAHIQARNLEGQLAELNISATIVKLLAPLKYKKEKYWPASDQYLLNKKEYGARFPNDAYELSQAQDWEVLDTIGQRSFFGKDIQTGSFNEMLSEGVYKLLFEVEDQEGNTSSVIRILHVSGKGKRTLPSKAIWSSGMNPSYQPGQKIDMLVAAPFKAYDIQYFISKGDQILAIGRLNKNMRRIEWPIDESHRGGLNIRCVMVKHNRIYEEEWHIEVPWSNKDLDIEITKMGKSILPGSEQSIRIKVTDENGDPVETELLASMYDSSLDAFVTHSWRRDIYPEYSYGMRIVNRNFRKAWTQHIGIGTESYYSHNTYYFRPELNLFGFEDALLQYQVTAVAYRSDGMVMKSSRSGMPEPEAIAEADGSGSENTATQSTELEESKGSTAPIRENLNETVFFYPVIQTDANGEAVIDYKMNDALTKWNLLLFAHNKSLSYGLKEESVQTQKPLMVEAFLPRFLRQKDSIEIKARVSNNSESSLQISAAIKILEPISESDFTEQFVDKSHVKGSQEIGPGESINLTWMIQVPAEFNEAIKLRVEVQSADYYDAEQHVLPVATNRVFVTEALPLYCGPHTTDQYEFLSLKNSETHQGRSSEKLRLEYAPDPSWMILKALPAMISDNSFQSVALMEGIYAARLGRSLLNTNPQLGAAAQKWQNNIQESPLRESEEYKLLNIEQSPWLNDALQEEMNMKKIGFLLDDNRYEYTLNQMVSKLSSLQQYDGGFAWVEGGNSNWYVTQYILELIIRLDQIDGEKADKRMDGLIANAVRLIDEKFLEHYKRNETLKSGVPPMIAQYLFVRHHVNKSMDQKLEEAISDYLQQGRELWTKSNTYVQSLLGRTYYLTGDTTTVNSIKTSLDERMVKNEETGYYWNDQAGYYWYELNLDKQAALIEFYKLLGADKSLLDGMRLWLLKNKQVNSWATAKGTASAVYSFYDKSGLPDAGGTLSFTFPVSGEQFSYDIKSLPDQQIDIEWTEPEFFKSNYKIEIDNSTGATGWGALFLQYYEDIDKVSSFKEAPITINKSIGYIKLTDAGEEFIPILPGDKLKIGDRLKSRIMISVDRPMEYVLLEDKRASGLEPLNVLSSYKWQDGLGYYQVTEDLMSKFFIEFLPKGNFVFEYDVFVSHAGVFSGGLSSIQSMYAPEFISHSDGLMLEVEN